MDINLQQVLTQIVGFLLLLWLMRKFAWGPLLGLLDERRDKIVGDMERIRHGQEANERLQHDYQSKLNDIDNQARARIQQAVVEGELQARAITDAARREAQGIEERAKQHVAQEVVRARLLLRDEVAQLAITSAAKILRAEIDGPRHREMVLRSIDEVHGRQAIPPNPKG
jgi:F-type H+-transporting ATPase subunit b